MSDLPEGWTDDMSIPIAPGRETDDLVDIVLEAMLAFAASDAVCLRIQQRFGLSEEDALLALDRIPGGVIRAITGNPANCPDAWKDPLAYAAFQRVWAEFPRKSFFSGKKEPGGRWVQWFEDRRKQENG